jgi:hypothetical protein
MAARPMTSRRIAAPLPGGEGQRWGDLS